MDGDTGRLIADTLTHMSWSYYAWFAIYVGLGMIGVVLPGLAALGVGGPDVSRRFAAAAALVAATYTFLKPHEYATGFDAGKQLAWQTKIAWELGTIDDAEVARRLEAAVAVTTFKYGGRLPAPETPPG